MRRWLQPAASRLDAVQRELLTIRSGDPLARSFARFGRHSWIAAPRVLLQNPGSVAIGEGVQIRSGVCIEALAPPGAVVLEVGDGTIVGHNVRFVALNGTTIEPECGIGHGVTIADCIHDWQQASPGRPPWDTPMKLGEPLVVKRGAWIGNGSVVLGGLTIGERSIIGPNAVVTRDVPPDTMVTGNPGRRAPFPMTSAREPGPGVV